MINKTIHIPNIAEYEKAARVLKEEGIVAYPTEGVYGLGCSPFSENAIKKLLHLKNRAVDKGFILIAADFTQIEPLLKTLPAERLKSILATWPGPVSWAWPKSAEVPAYIHGDWNSVVVRVSAHPIVQELCQHFGGPLVSTSANHQGEEPCKNAEEVQMRFDTAVDYILTGAVGGLKKSTPIFDALTGKQLR